MIRVLINREFVREEARHGEYLWWWLGSFIWSTQLECSIYKDYYEDKELRTKAWFREKIKLTTWEENCETEG